MRSKPALAPAQPSACLSLTGRVDLVGLVYQAAQVPRPELSALDGEPGACGWLTAAAVLMAAHRVRGVVSPDLLQQLHGRFRAQCLVIIPALGNPGVRSWMSHDVRRAPMMLEAGQIVIVVTHGADATRRAVLLYSSGSNTVATRDVSAGQV